MNPASVHSFASFSEAGKHPITALKKEAQDRKTDLFVLKVQLGQKI